MSKFIMGEHQQYAEFMMECNEFLGVFYEAGTGKTQIALSRAYHALERGEVDSVLVVCPASLTTNWQHSVDKMLDFEGYTEEGVERLRKALTIVSYQKTYKTVKTPVRHRDGVVTYTRKTSLREEVDRRWGMIIVDEAHRLGGHSSMQTKACMTLGRLADYRYALTGTPVSGGGGGPDYQKLYGIMSFLQPGRWSSWTEFCKQYVIAYDKWFKPRKYNNEACERLLKEHAIMARLEDCMDMPGETHDYVDCELAEKAVYKDLKNGLVAKYGLDENVAGMVYPKLLQICSGSLIVDGKASRYKTSKDEVLKELLEGTDEPVVIFCNFTASIDRCKEICESCGRKTVIFDSRVPSDEWMKFQFGDATAIVCQYAKGGEGLDLFKSNTLIYFEPCWSFLQLDQSQSRIMRTGQKRHCRYLYLRTKGTREADAWAIVRNGLDLTNEVFSRWAQEER